MLRLKDYCFVKRLLVHFRRFSQTNQIQKSQQNIFVRLLVFQFLHILDDDYKEVLWQ